MRGDLRGAPEWNISQKLFLNLAKRTDNFQDVVIRPKRRRDVTTDSSLKR